MTVHMIRLYCEPPKGEAETAVNNWVANYNEWESDPTVQTLRECTTAGGTVHVFGDYRFIQSGETATGILNDLSTRLQSLNGGLWHRLGYHVCSHDETSPSACSWDETVEYGTIPASVPAIEVK